jgi:hypothetical protein
LFFFEFVHIPFLGGISNETKEKFSFFDFIVFDFKQLFFLFFEFQIGVQNTLGFISKFIFDIDVGDDFDAQGRKEGARGSKWQRTHVHLAKILIFTAIPTRICARFEFSACGEFQARGPHFSRQQVVHLDLLLFCSNGRLMVATKATARYQHGLLHYLCILICAEVEVLQRCKHVSYNPHREATIVRARLLLSHASSSSTTTTTSHACAFTGHLACKGLLLSLRFDAKRAKTKDRKERLEKASSDLNRKPRPV